MSIRILLADDHQMMRQGLKSLLAEQPDFEVVGEAADGRTAVRLAQELSAAVVIMDVTMPDLNGVDATRQLKSEAPDVKVIGLSMHPERQFVLEMLSVGASGYLLKDCPFAELAQSIRAAVQGDVYLSPKVAGVVVRGGAHSNSAHGGAHPREREVLQQVAEGKNTKQVGAVPAHQHQDGRDPPPADHGEARAVQRRRAGPLRDPRGADAVERLTIPPPLCDSRCPSAAPPRIVECARRPCAVGSPGAMAALISERETGNACQMINDRKPAHRPGAGGAPCVDDRGGACRAYVPIRRHRHVAPRRGLDRREHASRGTRHPADHRA